ncbi:hypothetical protein ACNQVK_00810 [Mycobacterium sp. 134]|uniref:hypothetical protein n=1 Tax=Mycobacterium sp. 134 TaxID=3400425 RepID=UPI003AAA7F8A
MSAPTKAQWIHLLVWLPTSAIFPAAVFLAYVMAGDTWGAQIGKGQLLLVAAALTAPTIGSIFLLPGDAGWGRGLIFVAAFTHIGVTVFYFAAVADGSRNQDDVAWNSLWLYVSAIVVAAVSFMLSERANGAAAAGNPSQGR